MATLLKTILFVFISQFCFGQIQGDIRQFIDQIISDFPSENNVFQLPTTTELAQWESAIDLLLNDNFNDANVSFNNLNYQVSIFNDTEAANWYYLIQEHIPNSKYWGTYIINPNACRNVIIQCPHPKHDSNTGNQGIYCFQKLNTYAYFLSGSHRCNSTIASSCTGNTKVCSSESQPFKVSDNAHSTTTIFQLMTKLLANQWSDAYFIQLHGFGKKATDPYVILSNGSTSAPQIDYIPTLRDALYDMDNSLTFKIAHLDNWSRLIGRTNVQGRLLNGVSDPCSDYASSASGRFIHIEQERLKLRKDAIGWEKVSQAIASTFPCISTEIPVLTTHAIYPNPIRDQFYFDGKQYINTIQIFSLNGIKLKSFHNIHSPQWIDVSDLSPGIYILVLNTANGKEWSKLVLE